jgi:hypothetical protein
MQSPRLIDYGTKSFLGSHGDALIDLQPISHFLGHMKDHDDMREVVVLHRDRARGNTVEDFREVYSSRIHRIRAGWKMSVVFETVR